MEHVQNDPKPSHPVQHGTAWVLQVLVALVLGISALAKLAGYEKPVMLFESLGMEPAGRYLVALLELAAAVLLIIPFSAPWGAILAWGVMSGALIAHLTRLGVAGPMLPMALAAAFNWCAAAAILVLRRHQIEFIRCMFDCEIDADDSKSTKPK